MEEEEFKELWAAYEKKLDRSLKMNYSMVKDIQETYIRSTLKKLMRRKILVLPIILGVLFVVGLAMMANRKNPLAMLGFGGYIAYLVVGVYINIRQICMIGRINFSDGISGTQTKLQEIELSGIVVIRLMGFMAAAIALGTVSVQQNQDTLFVVVKWSAVLALSCFAVWWYRSFSLKNIDKPWTKKFIASMSFGKPLLNSLNILKEIEEFESENADHDGKSQTKSLPLPGK